MKAQPLTPQTERKRKILLYLPIPIILLTTLFFVALGGGKGDSAQARNVSGEGLNTKLPDAKNKNEGGLNKMSYYAQAALDSIKRNQELKSDPYYRPKPDTISDTSRNGKALAAAVFGKSNKTNLMYSGNSSPEASERQVYAKLQQLQETLNRPAKAPVANTDVTEPAIAKTENAAPAQVEDPQLRQMNELMQKILEIQHPEKINAVTKPSSDKAEKRFKAIPAVIDGKQKITESTVIRIRLLDTVTLAGQLLPKGQLIYGSCNLYNQRATVNIKIIKVGYYILPVDLTIFDMTDGMEGISAPEAITSDAVKDGANNGIQGMEFMSLDQSMTTQLTGAGVNAAKGLFSKKVKRVKATLKDGHLLLIRDNKKLQKSIF